MMAAFSMTKSSEFRLMRELHVSDYKHPVYTKIVRRLLERGFTVANVVVDVSSYMPAKACNDVSEQGDGVVSDEEGDDGDTDEEGNDVGNETLKPTDEGGDTVVNVIEAEELEMLIEFLKLAEGLLPSLGTIDLVGKRDWSFRQAGDVEWASGLLLSQYIKRHRHLLYFGGIRFYDYNVLDGFFEKDIATEAARAYAEDNCENMRFINGTEDPLTCDGYMEENLSVMLLPEAVSELYLGLWMMRAWVAISTNPHHPVGERVLREGFARMDGVTPLRKRALADSEAA
jgi:hypothetical protein